MLLNISPVEFIDAEVKVGVFEFEDDGELKKKLDALRDTYYESHVFRREGSRIICAPTVEGAELLGDSTEDVKLSENLRLCAVLIREALISYLHSIGRQILDYSPIELVADRQADLLAASVPQDLTCPPWLSMRPRYEIDVRVIFPDQQPAFVGAVLNVRTKRLIERPCDDLIAEGFPIGGLYVGVTPPHADKRVESRLRLVGRVLRVEGRLLVLDDVRDDIDTLIKDQFAGRGGDMKAVDAGQVMLKRSVDSFSRCMAHVFGERAGEVDDRLRNTLVEFLSGPTRLDNLKRVVTYLGGRELEMMPGIRFRLKPFFTEGQSRNFPRVQTAPKPTYVFDPAKRRTDQWHDRGLTVNGPYSAASHTPTKPRVCVICQSATKGRVEQFLFKFLHGIPERQSRQNNFRRGNQQDSQEKFERFANGLVGKYKLDDVSLKFFTSDGDTAEDYLKAVRQALTYQRDNNMKWDLALVQIEDRFHNLYGDRNPYFVTKAAFLAQQIPSQEFELETVNLPDSQLIYVLNNMALATYAKLGGVPWLMTADQTIAHEVVFGLGSASIGEGHFGKRERIVGITTVFTGEGKYHLSNLSQAVPIADYKEALLESLESTIKTVKQELNWQRREHVRLVFHSFKPFKDVEADAVKEVVSALSDYNVDLAFLHVVENHPFMLFDEEQKGVMDYKTRRVKGVAAPERGYFFRLSGYEVLMSLTGAREVKRPEDGMPHPIVLRLHRNSTFDDMTYLARQVYAFSCHSWRSFFASGMPVTILYSELIAKILGNFANVTNWNPDSLLDRIGKTRWFL
ncbi:MAG: hypothetical protein H7Z38_14865 [Rubrivivax sp.]|nr:hypothetical protein [Pyrinomonadaceae bacterium]